MSFLLGAPWGLLGLLSLPLIYFLHRYVVKGQERRVSSLALWADLEQLNRDGGQPEKPPLTWVLFFELLTALLLTLWLSGLDLWLTPTLARRIVVIVDASASMGEKSGTDSPSDRIIEHLRRIDEKAAGSRYALIVARTSADVRKDLTLGELVDQIRALPWTSPGWNLENALRAAEEIRSGADNLLVFSDDPTVNHPRLVRVGQPADNAAFVEATWEAGESPFVSIARFGRSQTVHLRVVLDGKKVSEQEVDLPTNGEVPLEIPVVEHTQLVEISLPSDRLALDDRVVLVRPQRRQVAVQVTDPRAAVRNAVDKAIRAIPLLVTAGSEGADLVIGDAPPSVFSWSLSEKDSRPASFQGDLQLDPFSPLLEGLSTQGLIWSARAEEPGERARELLTSASSPLLWLDGRRLVSNIDLDKSNLLAHAAFPILMLNFATAIDARLGGLPRNNFRMGEVLSFSPRASWKGPSRVTLPSGESLSFPEGTTVSLGALNEPGVHTLEVAGAQSRFAVNLSNQEESNLGARKPPTSAPHVVARVAARQRAGDWFRMLLLVCAGVSFAAAAVALNRQGRGSDDV